MESFKNIQLILLIFVVVFHVSSSTLNNEGTLCTSSDGSAGVCLELSACPVVQDGILHRRIPLPVICRHKLKDSVVCCPNTREVQSMKRVCERPTVNNSATSRVKRYRNIFGGNNVFTREFPHMAAIGFVKRGRIIWLCGGTLIHKRFVLTAAHCLEDTSWNRYGKARFVRLGDIDLNSPTDDVEVQMLNVVLRIPHPDYRAPQKYHDIGLLQLHNDVSFDSFVKPACLHSQYFIPDNTSIATGWGRTEKARRLVGQKLLKVELDFQLMQTCNKSMSKQIDPAELQQVLSAGLLDDSMLCVGVLEGGKDSCQGDSGGPLQVRAHSPLCDFDVVGITSFGLGCAEPDSPAVYTRVSKYVPWIESVVCSYTDGS